MSEKYNLNKAQEEADLLSKKIESGVADSYDEAEKILKEDRLSNLKLTPEQESIKAEMISLILATKIDSALKRLTKLPLEIVKTREVRSALKNNLVNLLSNGLVEHADDALKLEEFKLSPEETEEVAVLGIINALHYGLIDEALEIKEKFNLSINVLRQQKVQDAVVKAKEQARTHFSAESRQFKILTDEFEMK